MADGLRQLSDPSLPWPSDEQILADLEAGEADRLRALLAQAEEALELIATCQVQGDTWYGTALAQRSHAQRALAAVREGRR